MSSDRSDSDREGDRKHPETRVGSDESFEGDEKHGDHSDAGSRIPRNRDLQNSANSLEKMSETLITTGAKDDEKGDKYREESEDKHQDGDHSSGGSLMSRKRSHSDSSPPHSPVQKSKVDTTEAKDGEKREKSRDRNDRQHKDSGHVDEGSSHARKRSCSGESPSHSAAKKAKSASDKSERKGDEDRQKHRERKEEQRKDARSFHKESYYSSSSRKRSRSPTSSSHSSEKDGKTSSNTPSRFRIPKKKSEDKIEKKQDEKESRRESHDVKRSDSRDALKERPITSAHLKKEIKDLLRTEHHHLMSRGKEDSNGDVQGVEWCYKYLDPTIRGHITGGRAKLHHICRQCNRVCLHLLGKYGTGKRMCLACAARERGWQKKEVPTWYFHDDEKCHNCRDTRYSRPSYGSFYYSRY